MNGWMNDVKCFSRRVEKTISCLDDSHFTTDC